MRIGIDASIFREWEGILEREVRNAPSLLVYLEDSYFHIR